VQELGRYQLWRVHNYFLFCSVPVDCFKFLLLLRHKGSKMDRNWRFFCEKHWQSSIKLKGSLLFSYNISFFIIMTYHEQEWWSLSSKIILGSLTFYVYIVVDKTSLLRKFPLNWTCRRNCYCTCKTLQIVLQQEKYPGIF
jgi:hypothetical protein